MFFLPAFFVSAESPETGEDLFIKHRCVQCHTAGRGRFVGPDLKGVTNRHTEERVLLWITDPSAVYGAEGKSPVNEGYPPMPGTGVSAEDAEKIYGYLRSLRSVRSDSPDGGLISGRVTNRTAGKPLAGAEVLLGSFIGDRRISEVSAQTDKKGKFRFKGLSWVSSHKISIRSGGVLYETGKMVFKPRQKKMELDLPVYDSAPDDSLLGIELEHIIVEPFDGGLRVAEFVEFVNRGKAAVVPESGENSSSGRLGVPPGAQNLNLIHGTGGASSFAVLPGSKRVVFSYLIPFEGRKAVFTKTASYPTSLFTVLSPSGGGVEVAGLGEPKNVLSEDGRSFLRWDGNEIKKGGKVKISALSAGGKRPWVLPAVIFTLVIALAFLFRRFRG